jgi:hypothetical protein
MRRWSILLLVPAAFALAACGGSSHKAAPAPTGPCAPGLVTGAPGGHEIVCAPFTIRWVPQTWIVSRQQGFLFAATARRPPRLMNMFVAELGGPYLTLAALRASVRPQLPKLFPHHVADVRFSRARLPAGPAVVMTKPSSGPSSPAITIYLVLHDQIGYELEFETGKTPTRPVLATISRIAHALRFDGGVAPARYPVDYTLNGTATTQPGAMASSVQFAFAGLRFSGGKWRIDVVLKNTSPGLLTLGFRLLLVRYPDGSAAEVTSPGDQVRAATSYDPPLPRGGLAPGKTWRGTAVGADTSKAGPFARAAVGFRLLVPATSEEQNVVSADVVIRRNGG